MLQSKTLLLADRRLTDSPGGRDGGFSLAVPEESFDHPKVMVWQEGQGGAEGVPGVEGIMRRPAGVVELIEGVLRRAAGGVGPLAAVQGPDTRENAPADEAVQQTAAGWVEVADGLAGGDEALGVGFVPPVGGRPASLFINLLLGK